MVLGVCAYCSHISHPSENRSITSDLLGKQNHVCPLNFRGSTSEYAMAVDQCFMRKTANISPLRRHERTCSEGVRHVYNDSVYHLKVSAFQHLRTTASTSKKPCATTHIERRLISNATSKPKDCHRRVTNSSG